MYFRIPMGSHIAQCDSEESLLAAELDELQITPSRLTQQQHSYTAQGLNK